MKKQINDIKQSMISTGQTVVNLTKKSFTNTKSGFKMVCYGIKRIFLSLIIVLVAIGGFSTLQLFNDMMPKAEAKEPEPVVITETFVESELKTIGKFNTTDYNYTLDKEINEPLKLFEAIKIPGTTKSLKVRFTGTVKVGYLFDDLHFVTVGDTVIFSIPNKPHIENFITGQLALIEDGGWLNPIESSDYKTLSENVKISGLLNAEKNGIYDRAEQDMKDFLTAHFEELGYKVKFI